MWKTFLILILIGTIIAGCVEKTKNAEVNITTKNISNKTWYQYTYTGPQDRENAENARMAINPYLIKLGWRQGLAIVSYRETQNLSIIILIPFKLTNESIDYINQTLKNFSFYPVKLNEVIE